MFRTCTAFVSLFLLAALAERRPIKAPKPSVEPFFVTECLTGVPGFGLYTRRCIPRPTPTHAPVSPYCAKVPAGDGKFRGRYMYTCANEDPTWNAMAKKGYYCCFEVWMSPTKYDWEGRPGGYCAYSDRVFNESIQREVPVSRRCMTTYPVHYLEICCCDDRNMCNQPRQN